MFRSIPYTVHQKQRKGSADLMKLISIIVPCLNEQEVIPIFYRTVTEVLDSLEMQNTSFCSWMMAPMTGLLRC